MGYASFSKRPQATRGRFCGSDLARYVDAFARHLRTHGYAERSVRQYVGCIAHFAHWMREHRVQIADVNERLAQRFVEGHLPQCCCARRCQRCRHMVRAALVQLLIVLRATGEVPPPVSTDPEHIARELTEFAHYLIDIRGVAASTEVQRLAHVRAFLRAHFLRGAIQVARLRPAQVAKFFITYASHWTPSSKKSLGNSLRSYFRYKTLHGEPTAHVVAAIPRIAQWRMASLPKWLSADEIEQLLGAFDRNTSTGRRDYAITRCFVDMGLRTAEIARLRLEDVAWDEGTMRIRGKGRRIDLLPLPRVTGRAIVGYLREGRPTTPDRGLFVRHRPPVGIPITPGIVRSAVRYAARRCGIKQCVNGPHILRHTMAQRLLQGGSTLKQIADVLRHRCLDTTGIYAKVDVAALTHVALRWPGSRT